MEKPTIKPNNPNFSSGPCAKRPGWKIENLINANTGRSHRSGEAKTKLNPNPAAAPAKADREVKEEFWNKDEDRRELINSVVNAWEYYEGNKKEINYWMKNIFHWYYTHSITEDEVINSIQYLIENEILRYD